MKVQEFIIIARGGALLQPYVSHVKLGPDDPDWLEWAEAEGDDADSFDDWCNFSLNELVDELEQRGASAIVLSLDEYRNLPKH